MSNIFKRGWIDLSIHMGITSLGSYLEEMENNLEDQLNSLEKQYLEDIKDVSENEAENIFEYQYEDRVFYLREEFPNILRKSFVISLYSFLEQQLFTICKHVEKNNKLSISFNNFKKGTGIFKSYRYLTEIANIDLSSLDEEWIKIENINKIRNHFVHAGSDTLKKLLKPKNQIEEKSNRTIEAFISFNLAIEDENYSEFQKQIKDNCPSIYDLKINSAFCKSALEIIQTFFDKLTDLLKQ